MVSFALLLTFATAALAAPRGRNLAQRVAGRQAGTRQSLPMQQDDGPTNQTDATYSTNWAGAVLVADSAEYTSVTGTFTVPSPSLPDDALIGAYSASAWVGIDGDTCDTAILQTGVDFTIHALTGAIDYDVTFTDAEATTSSDSVGPSDATIIDIRQDLVVMTSVSVSSDEVTITYV
ncbi:concanavalin A-like lectin/glucanase [Fistulina hepatica ATCC 64428]|uniref:Concanavalin A-like lectin/glucanase n=1 Tax=Fistulina hepatica ATCC 64428 TaxID=1128425 RepID=A0A0D7AB05_9AGAR|nr:concanavalin A-like lectin/glucanase [Fistulina hepatica ATCC 64428]